MRAGSEPRGESRNDRFSRGDRFGRSGSDSRFQRPATTARTGRDYDYGPPPGYQPILLPGESISKYQRQGIGQNESASAGARKLTVQAQFASKSAPTADLPAAIVASFPEDEPIFAAEVSEPLHEQHEHVPEAEVEEEAVRSRLSGEAPDIAEAGHEARAIAEL